MRLKRHGDIQPIVSCVQVFADVLCNTDQPGNEVAQIKENIMKCFALFIWACLKRNRNLPPPPKNIVDGLQKKNGGGGGRPTFWDKSHHRGRASMHYVTDRKDQCRLETVAFQHVNSVTFHRGIQLVLQHGDSVAINLGASVTSTCSLRATSTCRLTLQ